MQYFIRSVKVPTHLHVGTAQKEGKKGLFQMMRISLLKQCHVYRQHKTMSLYKIHPCLSEVWRKHNQHVMNCIEREKVQQRDKIPYSSFPNHQLPCLWLPQNDSLSLVHSHSLQQLKQLHCKYLQCLHQQIQE